MTTTLSLDQKTWTETSASVREGLLQNFPNLEKFCHIGEGVLCYLDHAKPCYQIGFVFPVKGLGQKKPETIVYYPVKDIYIHLYSDVQKYPVEEASAFIHTKRGEMKIVEVSPKVYGVSFTVTAHIYK